MSEPKPKFRTADHARLAILLYALDALRSVYADSKEFATAMLKIADAIGVKAQDV